MLPGSRPASSGLVLVLVLVPVPVPVPVLVLVLVLLDLSSVLVHGRGLVLGRRGDPLVQHLTGGVEQRDLGLRMRQRIFELFHRGAPGLCGVDLAGLFDRHELHGESNANDDLAVRNHGGDVPQSHCVGRQLELFGRRLANVGVAI